MRGVGSVILDHDPLAGPLSNWWVSDHEVNHPAELRPLLVLDVFEHAWMVDDGAGEKGTDVKAFLENASWEIAEQRFRDSARRMALARG